MLVVTSKVKKHIKEKGQMSTSGTAVQALSKVVEQICEQAIKHAADDKRKTVMDRDIEVVVDRLAF